MNRHIGLCSQLRWSLPKRFHMICFQMPLACRQYFVNNCYKYTAATCIPITTINCVIGREYFTIHNIGSKPRFCTNNDIRFNAVNYSMELVYFVNDRSKVNIKQTKATTLLSGLYRRKTWGLLGSRCWTWKSSLCLIWYRIIHILCLGNHVRQWRKTIWRLHTARISE